MDIVTQNQILPIHEENGELWVDARTLHTALQVGRDFSTWIQGRLEEVGAQEGVEFIVLDGSPVSGNGFNPKPRRDYWLSLDLGKEIAMLEKNEIGKKIRRYFIQFEKQARASALVLPNFDDPIVAAEAWVVAKKAERAAQAEAQTQRQLVAQLAPQAEQYQALMSTEGTYSMAEAAKLLGTGEGRLFKLLRERNILMDARRSGTEHHNVPYQQYLDRGYFELITRPRPDGKRVTYTTRVTAKGLSWLHRNMVQQQLLPPAPSLPPVVNA